MRQVEIMTLPELNAATIAHCGPYIEIGRAFERLFGTLGTRNLLGPGQRMFGIYYDDPASIAEPELRSRAGIVAATSLRFGVGGGKPAATEARAAN